MKDVQSEKDKRGITIQHVGVSDVVMPIEVKDKEHGFQSTIASFNIGVELPADKRGTHMSRFIEYIQDIDEPLSFKMLMMTILPEIKRELEAESGQITVAFPYFVPVISPVSNLSSKLKVHVTFFVKDDEAWMTVVTPVTTVCPCSKEISDRGAHNQRGDVSISIKANGWVWVEELIKMAIDSASAPVFPLLKRPDEKAVTEQAYDNPRFVEDVVREVQSRVKKHPQILRYKIHVVNYESIHSHNAYAYIEGGDDIAKKD